MNRKTLGSWAPIFVVAAALVMLAVGTDAADAARGGKGGGKPGGGGGTTTATCQVTPNPAGRWSAVTISGSGFSANAGLGLTVRSESGNVAMTFATADSTGRFSTTYNTVWLGTNAVSVSGGSATAACSFQVV